MPLTPSEQRELDQLEARDRAYQISSRLTPSEQAELAELDARDKASRIAGPRGPQVIDHPTLGEIEFPGSMTDGEIVAAIKRLEAEVAPGTRAPALRTPDTAKAEQWAKASPWERAKLLMKGFGPAAGERYKDVPGMVADIGMEGGGAAGGQMVGAMGGPFAPITIPAGGAVGGLVGNVLAQVRRIKAGEQERFQPGQAGGAMVAGAIPGASLEKAGAMAAVREAAKQGVGGLAAKTVQTGIDQGRLPTVDEAALAGLLPAGGGVLAQRVQEASPAVIQAVAAERAKNAVRNATLAAGKEAGYVLPPSAVNPSMLNRTLETVAGKAAVKQAATIQNQGITDMLAKRALGLPEDSALSEALLRQVRDEAAEPYRQVAAMSTRAANDLEKLKQARSDANIYWKHYGASADPSSLAKAQAAGADANALEASIEQAATAAGQPELVDSLRAGRQRIAKTYTVERALNLGDGSVSAPAIGRAMDKGAPLTDDLATIGQFQQAFPAYTGEGNRVPTPGVSKIKGVLSATGATVGALHGGAPLAVAGAALPMVADDITRAAVLSRVGQALLAKRQPRYDRGPDKIGVLVRQMAQAAARK